MTLAGDRSEGITPRGLSWVEFCDPKYSMNGVTESFGCLVGAR